MRVVINGGTGLIGRALSADLASRGHEVTVLSRDPGRHAGGLPAGARLVQWDGRTPTSLAPLLDGTDAVVSLAGASVAGGRWTASRKAAIRESRLQAARGVVGAMGAVERRPRLFLLGSGVGVYGPRGEQPVLESDAPGTDFLARVAVDSEAEAAKASALGVTPVAARTGVVLARDGGALPLMALPFRLFVGGPVGSGRQYVPWIHISDEIAALRFLLEDERAALAGGPFNLTAPCPVTNAEFGRAIGRVLHRPALMPAPSALLRLVLGEMSSVLLDGQRAVPRRLLDLGFSFRFGDLGMALQDVLQPDGARRA